MNDQIQKAFDDKYAEIGEEVWHDLGNDRVFYYGWKACEAAQASVNANEQSQAQQPDYKLNELAQMIMSDCGISTINNDALFNRILDRLINASDLQIRPDVLCGGCKGIRSSDCPDCNGSGKMTDPRAQAQQPSCTYTWNCPRCGSGKCVDESDASQAQQTQEPVAWMNPYGGLLHVRETGLEKATFTIPLYLQSQAQQSQWISVEERLPAYGQIVDLSIDGVLQNETYEIDATDNDLYLTHFWTRDGLDDGLNIKQGQFWRARLPMPKPLPPAPEGVE